MPVVVHVGIMFVEMGVFAGDLGMRGREFFAEPSGDAEEVEDPEEDEHKANGKLHREADTRGNHQIEKDDGGADENDGDGVTESPKSTDKRSFGERTFAAHDGGDGDDVVRVRGMAHAQKEANGENGKSADHRKPSVAG